MKCSARKMAGVAAALVMGAVLIAGNAWAAQDEVGGEIRSTSSAMRTMEPSPLLLAELAAAALPPLPATAADATSTNSTGYPMTSGVSLKIEGPSQYSFNRVNNTAQMFVTKVCNTRSTATNNLKLVLWATAYVPISGSSIVNITELASFPLAPLAAGACYQNFDTNSIAFSAPASGNYYVTMALVEQATSVLDFEYNDLRTYPPTQTFAPSEVCVTNDTTLCLLSNRFKVQVTWRAPDNVPPTGSGFKVPFGSADSGLMYFFNPDNWELLAKAVNGCSFNSRYWFFAALTTNVEYNINVTDTANGSVKNYFNPFGNPSPAITDAAAFATCP